MVVFGLEEFVLKNSLSFVQTIRILFFHLKEQVRLHLRNDLKLNNLFLRYDFFHQYKEKNNIRVAFFRQK